MRFSWLLCLCAVGLCSCAAQRSGGSSSAYHEDLSAFRPQVPADTASTVRKDPREREMISVTPTLQVNRTVNNVLDSIATLSQMRKFVDGFTIQIYSGTSREDAMTAKRKMTELPDLIAILQYNQPKFRVTVGSYYSRLEAQKDLQQIKKILPTSILVPEKVAIN